MNFSFKLKDIEAENFCKEVVQCMSELCSISKEEALSRVNHHWLHLEVFGGEDEIAYHEAPDFWAQDIYYGSDSYWWLSGTSELV
ncbi:hypothetical protein [Pseudoalteromonas luteoviolacea]|uniref:hypothetical protein n=1 Tax=Pseudoalteromonas luteoviolacea TaxID=43657 RepID=UPI00114F271E|nr:hypothetical protein [Pseudoalteromonas luteoviolacea]TQF70151.1 hypothetical protein FLM44_03395 [Pseudoalteromonas luteoviolacea]